MKRLCSALLSLFLLSNLNYADILQSNIEDRVKENNLIVIGRLSDVFDVETETEKTSKGILTVEEIIYGDFSASTNKNLKSGNRLRVEWTNSKVFACQFGFYEGYREIWFLKVDDEGNVVELTPSTVSSLWQLSEVKKFLAVKPKPSKIFINLADSYDGEFLESEHLSIKKYEVPAFYSPLSTGLVILTSIFLYLILYRSRFRIR